MEPAGHGKARLSTPAKVISLVIAGLILLLILLAVLLVIFVQSSAFEAQVKERGLPAVSDRLGRRVTVETVRARVLPRPTVTLGGLHVAGLSDVPLLVSEEVVGRLRIWPLLRSRGQELALDSLRFKGTTLNLVRLRNGSWDVPRPPPSERKLVLDLPEVALQEGSFHVIDEGGRMPPFDVMNLRALASFRQGLLAFRDLTGEAYGASLSAGGTRLELGKTPIPWTFEGRIDGLELLDLPTKTRAMQGILAAKSRLQGAGLSPNEVATRLSGDGDLQVRDMVWNRLDLEGALAGALAGLVERYKVPISIQRPPPKGTEFRDIDSAFAVREGWLEFSRPVALQTPAGNTNVGGRMRLTMDLDLKAETLLEPDFVSTLTRGELRPDAPVPVAYRIRGTFSKPRVEEVDASAFIPVLAKEGGKRLERELKKVIPPFGATPAPPRTPP